MTATNESHIPPWGKTSHADKLRFFCGNEEACRIMDILALWTHVYDDLIDGDAVAPENIHRTFWALLIELPSIPLYRALEHHIRPIYMTGIMNWHAANEIEKKGDVEELRIAHAIRYSIVDVGFILMMSCGGQQHAIAHAREMRLKFQCDTWAHYVSEHEKEAKNG